MIIVKIFLFVIPSLLLSSCASIDGRYISNGKYKSIIEDFSKSSKAYSGIYNLYEIKITALNTQVREAQIKRELQFMNWNDVQVKKQSDLAYAKISRNSEFFVAFYTPNRQDNNLSSGDGSSWRIFLEYEGKTYTGKARKPSTKYARLKYLYPYYSKFYKPYILSFDIPMSILENTKTIDLVIRGGSLSKKIQFKK